jgi:hypothetical protein
MSSLQISTQENLLTFLKDNLLNGKNLSIRGLATLCAVQHTTLIRDGAFNSGKLGQTLTEQGFEAGALSENGFDAKATWLVIEYFAYESKAKAPGAKQLARTFGQVGVQLTFDKLTEKEAKPKQLPATYKEALLALLAEIEEKEKLSQIIQSQEQDLLAQAEVIDELFDYSSIIRIAKYNQCSEKEFNWRLLKQASINLNLEVKKVPCPRFETKNLYSHDVWRLAYPEYKVPETTTLIIKH